MGNCISMQTEPDVKSGDIEPASATSELSNELEAPSKLTDQSIQLDPTSTSTSAKQASFKSFESRSGHIGKG